MTCGFVVLLWLLGAATASVLHGPPIRISRMVAAGVRSLEHGHVWTPLTAVMFAPDLAGYIVGTVCVLLLAVPTERRLGSGRFAVAALCTQVLGVLLALGVVQLIGFVDGAWAHELSRYPAVGPTTFAVGVALVASAGLDTLWRRRLRVGLLVVLGTVMLYGGLLEDVVRFACAVIGLLMGPVLVGRGRSRIRLRPGTRLTGTRREGRVLVAIVVSASALGPVLAASHPRPSDRCRCCGSCSPPPRPTRMQCARSALTPPVRCTPVTICKFG